MKNLTMQSTNKIDITGKLIDVAYGEGTLSDGRHYERATVTLRVKQTYGGKEEISEIPITMFGTTHTTRGTPNPAYQNIQNIKLKRSAQEVGFDNADTLRFSSGSIQENMFISKTTGQLINNWQINSSFMNSTTGSDIAAFTIDIYIMDMHPEEDRDGDPTGRLIIKGGIVQYGEKLDVIEFIVENPEAVEYIERNWEINDTVTVRGRIRMTAVEEKPSGNETSSWGEDIPQSTSTRYIKELIITKGDDEGKEEEFAYDPTEIKKGFNARKARMEQLQLDAKNGSTAKKAAASNKYSWE